MRMPKKKAFASVVEEKKGIAVQCPYCDCWNGALWTLKQIGGTVDCSNCKKEFIAEIDPRKQPHSQA